MSKVKAIRPKSSSKAFLFFIALWINLCKSNDLYVFFQCVDICQKPRELLQISALDFGFPKLSRDIINVDALKFHV